MYFTPLQDGQDGIVSIWNQHITANEILGVLCLIWVFRAQSVFRVPIGRPHFTKLSSHTYWWVLHKTQQPKVVPGKLPELVGIPPYPLQVEKPVTKLI